jgi:hypothetical protein
MARDVCKYVYYTGTVSTADMWSRLNFEKRRKKCYFWKAWKNYIYRPWLFGSENLFFCPLKVKHNQNQFLKIFLSMFMWTVHTMVSSLIYEYLSNPVVYHAIGTLTVCHRKSAVLLGPNQTR